MSEVLAGLKKIGGSGGENFVETVLWTNSSPTSSFAGLTVTLSDNIENYSYIKVVSAFNIYTLGKTSSVMMSIDDLKKTGSDFLLTSTVMTPSNSYMYVRPVAYKTSTTVEIGACYMYIYSSSGQTTSYEPAATIPLKIIGVKKQGGSKASELSCSTWTTTGAGTTFPAEIGKYYMLFINTVPSYAGYNLCVDGGTIITNHYDNYGGRCAIVEIILATSTTVTTFSSYMHFCELIIS